MGTVRCEAGVLLCRKGAGAGSGGFEARYFPRVAPRVHHSHFLGLHKIICREEVRVYVSSIRESRGVWGF